MQYLQQLPEAGTYKNTYLAIGSFDGVHLGHQQLIKTLVDKAKANDGHAAVLSFFPHPKMFFGRETENFYITTVPQKLRYLDAIGVETAIILPFETELSQTSASAFLNKIHSALDLCGLWAGADFSFGHKREGNLTWLRSVTQNSNISINEFPAYKVADETVSSTRIRAALYKGDVACARTLMGRPFKLDGVIEHGDHRGSKIGFPTANLSFDLANIRPMNGVYATRMTLGNEVIDGVTNVGVRPTFKTGEVRPTIETFLFDFNRDIYGEAASLDFIDFVRPEQKFDGIDAIIAQIQNDIETAKDILKTKE